MIARNAVRPLSDASVGLDIIGGDVVEVAPQYDATTNTAMVGAQMLFEIFSLVTLSPNFHRRGGP